MRTFDDEDTGTDRAAELLLRRMMLADTRHAATADEMAECATAALALGQRDAARALFALAFLQRGFAPAQLRQQAELAQWTALWDLRRPERMQDAAPASMLDQAIGELTGLIGTVTLPTDPVARADLALTEGLPAALDRIVLEDCPRLFMAMRTPQPSGELGALLDMLATDALGFARIDLTQYVDVPTPRLLVLYAFRGLQDFLRAHHELAFVPGSPDLLHAVARLSPTGLGAYLRNVRHVVRDGADISGLIRLADAESRADAVLPRWAAILAVGLDQDLRLGLVDEMADRGEPEPLWIMLKAVERTLGVRDEMVMLWRLRDAGADLFDMDLALRAQWLVARQRVHSAYEWVILGDMRVTVGDLRAAENDYAYAAGLSVNDNAILARLDALRAGEIATIAAVGGFGTQRGRQRRRLARAGMLPTDPLPLADMHVG
ncbi:hypothetical protein [uncultured Sphingomonas sp.]|uniref:hypothetical protein n=1 Tax=uncultured Sphingomonas sp. TaxID=158754 RepID=UPI0025F89191|nr:hypothetical protein [uncultured Sphingomonas sp.]